MDILVLDAGTGEVELRLEDHVLGAECPRQSPDRFFQVTTDSALRIPWRLSLRPRPDFHMRG